MNKQAPFHGGLTLTAHKHVSPIIESHLPKELIYPLLQRADNYATPCIKQGDHVLKGQVIAQANNSLCTPIHAASSGTIKTIAPHMIAHPSNLEDDCIIISTDGLDESLPYSPCPNYQQETREQLLSKIQQAGISGLGGAVFPTANKLSTLKNIQTLIINGAECEPYISCDESLVLQQAEQIIQGTLILQHLLQAENCLIAIEDNMQQAAEALQKAIRTHPSIQLKKVPSIYPIGGEKQLIQALTGHKIPAQSLPAEQGFICQNIGTTHAIYQAIILGCPLTERIITVTGKGVVQTQNIRSRIGTPIKDLVKQAGGYNDSVKNLIMGGPMMGIALSTDEIAVTKASNCILVTSINEQSNHSPEMPCIRCGDCASVCPAELLPQQLLWYGRSKQLEQCQDHQLFSCIECGCCDLVCPSHIPLVQQFRATKSAITLKNKHAAQAQLAKKRFQNQQKRRDKQEQELLAKAEKRKATIEKMKAASLARKKKP